MPPLQSDVRKPYLPGSCRDPPINAHNCVKHRFPQEASVLAGEGSTKKLVPFSFSWPYFGMTGQKYRVTVPSFSSLHY